MPAQSAGAGTFSKENRYPAQITSMPVSTASTNVGKRLRASANSVVADGRRAMMYQTSASAMAAGMNGSAENFESTASPVHAPKSAADASVGLSIQISAVRNEAPVKAVRAISVVASPACANTGGRNVKRKTATAASKRPK